MSEKIGHLHRVREIKKAEIAAVPTHAPERQEKEEAAVMTRRSVLGGLFASGAAIAAPTILKPTAAEAGMFTRGESIVRNEAVASELIEKTQRVMESPEFKAALAGNHHDPLRIVLRAMRYPIPSALIKHTKFDSIAERLRYAVQMVYTKTADGKRGLQFVSKFSPDPTPVSPDIAGYANCGYIGRPDQLMSTHHAVDTANGKPDSKKPRDLWALRLPKSVQARPEQIVQIDPTLRNEHIHGKHISVEGYDPDSTSDGEGKSYHGVAIQLSRQFVERVFRDAPPEIIERLSKSFMFRLPPGEAQGATIRDVPATGMSGSFVYTVHNGVRAFAGVFHSQVCMTDPETGEKIDVGFFHAIDEVNAQIQEQNRTGA